MIAQVFWGSLLLGACSMFHLVALLWWVHLMRDKSDALSHLSPTLSSGVVIGGTFAVILASHTIQIWAVAASLVGSGALSSLSDALYFSLVTYTTLGYGDLTLTEGFRIFGAMASVTGLLNFGISTAVLVAVLTRILNNGSQED